MDLETGTKASTHLDRGQSAVSKRSGATMRRRLFTGCLVVVAVTSLASCDNPEKKRLEGTRQARANACPPGQTLMPDADPNDLARAQVRGRDIGFPERCAPKAEATQFAERVDLIASGRESEEFATYDAGVWEDMAEAQATEDAEATLREIIREETGQDGSQP